MEDSVLNSMFADKEKTEEVLSFFAYGKELRFEKGETIINGIDEPDGVLLIKEGFVKAFSITKEGFNSLVIIHDGGEFIPLTWALDGDFSKGLFYVAMSPVVLIKISKEKLHQAMSKSVVLSQEILNQVVNIASFYIQRIQSLEYRSVRDRVVSELLQLAQKFGVKSSNDIVIQAPITHQDIADSINTTRETASRVIESLCAEKILRQKGHSLVVLDIEKLQNELQ